MRPQGDTPDDLARSAHWCERRFGPTPPSKLSPNDPYRWLASVTGIEASGVYRRIYWRAFAADYPQGWIIGVRRAVVRRAIRRLGPPSAVVLARLEGLADTSELERLDVALDTAATWDDWLGR